MLDLDVYFPAELLLDCPVCGQAGPAEIPPCQDGHGDTCPDRLCSRCGAALMIDPFLTVAAFGPQHGAA